MSRTTIFSEQFSDPNVADALREHREDRDHLRGLLTASLQADPRVRAAWLWGSFGRGEADDLSDLDPWMLVDDDTAGEMGASLRQYAMVTGSYITGGEAPRNGPPGGGFFSSLHEGRHGLLHLDCYWQPESDVEEIPEQAVLFDRRHEPYVSSRRPPSTSPASETLTEEQDRIEGGIGFTWLMLSITAKTLARNPDSDMGLMAYPRPGLEEAALLLEQASFVTASDWLVPEHPWEKVSLLRNLAKKTAHLSEIAHAQGIEISRLNAICLDRYLEMVAGILR